MPPSSSQLLAAPVACRHCPCSMASSLLLRLRSLRAARLALICGPLPRLPRFRLSADFCAAELAVGCCPNVRTRTMSAYVLPLVARESASLDLLLCEVLQLCCAVGPIYRSRRV